MQEGKLSFDGIFCVTDRVAWSVLGILKKLGQKVPKDVQVIGFDGIHVFGEGNYVCSTILQPIPDIAELCVELLLQENIMPKTPLVCLPVTYVPGGTTLDPSGEQG